MTNVVIDALDLEDMSRTSWTNIIIVQPLSARQNSIHITRCIKEICMNTRAINERIVGWWGAVQANKLHSGCNLIEVP